MTFIKKCFNVKLDRNEIVGVLGCNDSKGFLTEDYEGCVLFFMDEVSACVMNEEEA